MPRDALRGLSSDDCPGYAALAYYFDHRPEIDRSLAERDALVEALRQQTPPKLLRPRSSCRRAVV